MTNLRPTSGRFSFTTQADYRQHLRHLVLEALPVGVELVAANFARSTASSYWLLKKPNDKRRDDWLTLRIATHRLWLEHARQIEVLWQHPGDFNELAAAVKERLTTTAVVHNQFQLTKLDIALLRLLTTLERHKLIWFIKMTETVASAHKAVPLDLKADFNRAQLYLGDRNNANALLIPVKVPAFQKQLAVLYGQNLLFSQFTKHELMKLLPTNQWIQPMLAGVSENNDWQSEVAGAYGEDFVQLCDQLIEQRAR
jgi:hypothetical protein